jgi:aspartyl-tRNA(Asn)/glutamyl-tRNA(Gln) amidotransferase subunit A
VEVTGQVLERARRIQPEVNAFVRLTEEDALARARESQARF